MSIETRISSTTTIRGRVSGSDDLYVDGQIEGDVSIDGDLFLDGDARIDGNIEAKQVEINGIVKGNISASTALLISKTAKIQGDLVSPSIVIDDGAMIRGAIDVGGVSGKSSAGSRSKPAKKTAQSKKPVEEPELPEGTVARKVKVQS